MRPDESQGLPRRSFVRAAVAIGGTSALTACLEQEQNKLASDGQQVASTEAEPEFPRGDPESVPDGQHRWGEYLVRDAHGNTVPPQQLVVVGLDYEGSAPPTDAERTQVEQSLALLDRAFQWGTGGNAGAAFNRGLLFMIGYAPKYFEQVGASVPEGLTPPETVLESVGEDPAHADSYDAVLMMTSDIGSVLLAAESALFGEVETVNGLPVESTLEGVFSKAGRHVGYIGKGLPADKLDNEDIPEDAPLSMGFKSGFRDNLPPEDRVTIDDGPFAGGTTIASSTLRIDLDRWYDQTHQERTEEMFCPAHTSDEVGPVGEKLGGDSGITEEDVDRIEDDAEEYGKIGHTQKVARARDDDFHAKILRRTEGVADTVTDGAGFQFNSIQETMADFVETRVAMNPDEYDDDLPAEDHGITDYLETLRRGSYLAPTRDDWALPVV
ncbi:DUF7405 family protein [Salinirubrum litoreum]|uniref:Deferrochelatase/peroxidase EfeB n=1 Tax=Salinirubrum litoreum TaxID=1126234 RepID=A0ABD5RGW7_9EURY|nr:hypothetical protein [Salinirubrum litoreum]